MLLFKSNYVVWKWNLDRQRRLHPLTRCETVVSEVRERTNLSVNKPESRRVLLIKYLKYHQDNRPGRIPSIYLIHST